MHERPNLLAAFFVVGAIALQVAVQSLAGPTYRVPRLPTLAVAAIGLRWGSVAGGFWGGAAGLLLALISGEPPFAATAALAAAGWVAGELPGRFVIESRRAVAVAVMVASVVELALVGIIRGIVPPGGLKMVVWAAGWAVVLGPPVYRALVRFSTPPPAPRQPVEG